MVNELWIPSQHYSSGGISHNKAVLHTTEGAMKIRDLGAWFQNPAAQCSSHHGADNYEANMLGAYVYESNKAWTQGNANPYCVSLEQCAYASWSRDTWLNQKGVLLRNTADWLAYVCGKYGIPLRALSNSESQNSSTKGVCQHVQLGSWGSGHSDCGGGFPMDVALDWAKSGGGGGSASSGSEGLVTSAVCFWRDPDNGSESVHEAMIWKDGRVCYSGPGTKGFQAVDQASKAKNGLGIAASYDGKIIITYANESGVICHYEKAPAGSVWKWVALKGTESM